MCGGKWSGWFYSMFSFFSFERVPVSKRQAVKITFAKKTAFTEVPVVKVPRVTARARASERAAPWLRPPKGRGTQRNGARGEAGVGSVSQTTLCGPAAQH